MKLASNDLAYEIQRKYLLKKDISGYKIGASNHKSAEFFSTDQIILGGIEGQNIFHEEVPYSYDVAEIEIIYKIRIDLTNKKFNVLNKFIGIECPFQDIKNPTGSEFICITDNCSAGDLIILEEIKDDTFTNVRVYFDKKTIVDGSQSNLKYSCCEIINKAIKIIDKYDLPSQNELYIATGGISDTFQINPTNKFRLEYEY